MMTTLDIAQQEVSRLEQTITDWQARRDATARRLAEVQHTSAQSVLDGNVTPASVAQQQAHLQDEIATIEQVLSLAQERYKAAARRVEEARLSDLREQEAQLRQEADRLEGELAPHVAALKAIDPGVEVYSPAVVDLRKRAGRLQTQALEYEVRLQHADRVERDQDGNEIRRYRRASDGPAPQPATRYQPGV